jgi:chorismate mutase
VKELREQIDRIDGELMRFFGERMETVRQIALYKKENNLPLLDAAREREKLDVIDCPYAKKLCAVLMELSREYQEEII